MQPINQWDNYYDDGERVVLTFQEMQIPGLRLLGKHATYQAAPALKPHYHEKAFEFACLAKGSSSFHINETKYRLTGGDIFVADPDQIHHTGINSLSAKEFFWFQLDVSTPQNFLFLGTEGAEHLINALWHLNNRVIKTDVAISGAFLDRIFALAHEAPQVNSFSVAGLLVSLLYYIIDCDKHIRFRLTPDIANSVNYILENISAELSLETLAEVSKLSLSHFKHKFKDQLGSTPREFINSQKVEEAKEMLKKEVPIIDIAMDLGFSSSNYFAVVFKQFTSHTPTEYKLLLEEKPVEK